MSKSNHSNKIEQLEFDGLVLKNLSKTLTINNIEIPMRIKEFELLWYLASREGEVISKSELLEKYGDMTITKMLTLSMSTYIEFAKLEKHDFYPTLLQLCGALVISLKGADNYFFNKKSNHYRCHFKRYFNNNYTGYCI